ncbi:hypothetical protein BJ982_003575 [Sphaerisporangium siamense]|uniref:Uncharacterized protein n=1 Tax=Sphaerisporangium siamense TaxID=795645 RepID=A0A7W7D8K2_9ACTN|nr:hypothetical protein [Sphaerisporangium siamense]MBB4702031.1 hypothetical protein [Sphaerisporangium siamense]
MLDGRLLGEGEDGLGSRGRHCGLLTGYFGGGVAEDADVFGEDLGDGHGVRGEQGDLVGGSAHAGFEHDDVGLDVPRVQDARDGEKADGGQVSRRFAAVRHRPEGLGYPRGQPAQRRVRDGRAVHPDAFTVGAQRRTGDGDDPEAGGG